MYVLPLAQNQREVFKTPGLPSDGWTNGEPLSLDEIRDGASNTLLIGEVAENFKPWGHPANLRDPSRGIGRSPGGFAGPPGAGGAQFLMCDGSVRLLSDKTDPNVIRALGTPAGGEDVSVARPPPLIDCGQDGSRALQRLSGFSEPGWCPCGP